MKPSWIVFALLALLLGYLLFWPVPIDPAAWQPQPAPALDSGPFAVNTELTRTRLISTAPFGKGPDTVTVDPAGNIYCGLENGVILTFSPDGSSPRQFAQTGGHPLGLAFGPDGQLWVADGKKGLISIDSSGKISPHTVRYGEEAFGFTDDLDFGPDGKVYFSDASVKFGVGKFKDDLFEHRPNGRLYRYDPATKTTERLLPEMYFANGVTLSADSQAVLVVETSKYRVIRYWIAGPKAGSHEVFIDNLPGFPDGISYDGMGTYWVAVGNNPRNKTLDQLLPYPFLRKIVKRLPEAVQPKETRYAMVLGFDTQGKPTYNLQDPGGIMALISAVERHGDFLYIGSLKDESFGLFQLTPAR
jgi:sugar lactone lactonase YvrE